MIFFFGDKFYWQKNWEERCKESYLNYVKFQLMLIFIDRSHPIIDLYIRLSRHGRWDIGNAKISVINFKKYEVYFSMLLLIDYLLQFKLVDTDIPSNHLVINRKSVSTKA